MTDEATPPVDETPPVVESTPAANVSDDPSGDPPADPPAATADPDSDADAPPPEEGARRGRAQERIEELASNNKYLREHNEFLREALMKGLKPPATAEVPAPVPQEEKPDEAPTLESCGYDAGQLARETAAWLKREVARGVSAELSTREVKATTQSHDAMIVESAKEFRKEHPDFDVIVTNPKLPWTPTVLEALKAAGAESPALGYYLGNNPDKLAKIAAQSPAQMAMSLGRILAELATTKAAPVAPKAPVPPKAPPKQPPKTTNAPPPPTPVSGSSSPDVDPLKMTGIEWQKYRTAQVAERNAKKFPNRRTTVRDL